MKKVLSIVLCIAALIALILPRVLTEKQFAEAMPDPVVTVEKPESGNITLTTNLIGSIEPEDVVYVYPKAAGEVTEVKVKAGDQVEAGELICIIDTKQVENAKSTLDSAQLALKQAQEDYNRQAVLYGAGDISQQAYEQSQDTVKAAQITVHNAENNYNNQVSYSQLKAPISGKVEVCNIETFDTVSQGNLICVISGQGAKIVMFSATERVHNSLTEGKQIRVEKDGAEYMGAIYEVSSMADESTGLFQVKARLDGDTGSGSLPTGSLVKLSVVKDHAENVMTVPIDSIYYDDGLAYVYVYDQGVVHKIQVEPGISDAERMEIRSGLHGDEDVLISWSTELYEGARVQLQNDLATEIETQNGQ